LVNLVFHLHPAGLDFGLRKTATQASQLQNYHLRFALADEMRSKGIERSDECAPRFDSTHHGLRIDLK
jgi:hypothetical protein